MLMFVPFRLHKPKYYSNFAIRQQSTGICTHVHTKLDIEISTPGKSANNKVIFIDQIRYIRNNNSLNFQEI